MELSKQVCFRSLLDARVDVGANAGVGQETPEHYIVLCVFAQPVRGENVYGPLESQTVDLAIALRPHQVAQIVWAFFSNLTYKGGFMKKALRRLVAARRRLMSSSVHVAWAHIIGGGKLAKHMAYHKEF